MGESAIYLVVRNDHVMRVKALLDTNVPVNLKTSEGLTTLHIAARYGRCNIVLLLLAAGADVDNTYVSSGSAPYIAAQQGYIDIVMALLDHDTVVEKTNSVGEMALHTAARCRHVDIATAHLRVKRLRMQKSLWEKLSSIVRVEKATSK
uniref:Uncharacterized protein n=1 Tax=Globisporangium ultimum (strain ATCC 200006 / CBS 805.95 / DAOM BR144) TaxID=431595 RepID=K3WWB6_GLOUD